MIDRVLRPLSDWLPGDPVNLLIGAGAGALAFAYILFAAARGRDRTRHLEAPGPTAEAAIHYEYGGLSREQKWLPALILVAFWLFEMWDTRRGEFDLTKLVALGVPTLVILLLHERRRLRARPAVALHSHGILLDSWRGETLVPWKDIDFVATDPPVSTGYQPNTHVRLLVGRKDGRQWRYSERDFGDEAQSRFDMIVALAQRHIQ